MEFLNAFQFNGCIPRESSVVWGSYILNLLIPKQKTSHNQKGTTLEPVDSAKYSMRWETSIQSAGCAVSKCEIFFNSEYQDDRELCQKMFAVLLHAYLSFTYLHVYDIHNMCTHTCTLTVLDLYADFILFNAATAECSSCVGCSACDDFRTDMKFTAAYMHVYIATSVHTCIYMRIYTFVYI